MWSIYIHLKWTERTSSKFCLHTGCLCAIVKLKVETCSQMGFPQSPPKFSCSPDTTLKAVRATEQTDWLLMFVLLAVWHSSSVISPVRVQRGRGNRRHTEKRHLAIEGLRGNSTFLSATISGPEYDFFPFLLKLHFVLTGIMTFAVAM